jgi:hypothetical protein
MASRVISSAGCTHMRSTAAARATRMRAGTMRWTSLTANAVRIAIGSSQGMK